MYLFGGPDDSHKLLKFHIFSKQTPTSHFIMAGSLRRPGQVLLTDLKEVQLFKKDLEIKKIMRGWNKARSSFLNPWLKIVFFAAPLYFFSIADTEEQRRKMSNLLHTIMEVAV